MLHVAEVGRHLRPGSDAEEDRFGRVGRRRAHQDAHDVGPCGRRQPVIDEDIEVSGRQCVGADGVALGWSGDEAAAPLLDGDPAGGRRCPGHRQAEQTEQRADHDQQDVSRLTRRGAGRWGLGRSGWLNDRGHGGGTSRRKPDNPTLPPGQCFWSVAEVINQRDQGRSLCSLGIGSTQRLLASFGVSPSWSSPGRRW